MGLDANKPILYEKHEGFKHFSLEQNRLMKELEERNHLQYDQSKLLLRESKPSFQEL